MQWFDLVNVNHVDNKNNDHRERDIIEKKNVLKDKKFNN